MNPKKIYYRAGYFRLLNGHWHLNEFIRLTVDVYINNDRTEVSIVGVQANAHAPLFLASGFKSREEAQEELDNFFIKGGLDNGE